MRRLGLSLVAVIPLGFATKLYSGPGAGWINCSLGGLFYVLFWCLLVQLLRPHWRAVRIAAGVLLVTCGLEFLQLWQTPLLEPVRGTFLGRTLLGDTFAWSDFPWYFAGGALGGWWLERVNRARCGGSAAGPSTGPVARG
jgi:hypothetical protein